MYKFTCAIMNSHSGPAAEGFIQTSEIRIQFYEMSFMKCKIQLSAFTFNRFSPYMN